jgi:hypothetical protein
MLRAPMVFEDVVKTIAHAERRSGWGRCASDNFVPNLNQYGVVARRQAGPTPVPLRSRVHATPTREEQGRRVIKPDVRPVP